MVTLAHDWGGPVSLGWAQRHTDRLRGVVLTNTGVHQPSDVAPPLAIRVARSPALLDLTCRRTPAFVRATTALSRPALPRPVRDAFAAPYATPARRDAVRDFVADIPFETGHPSRATLDAIRDGLADLADVPVLMVWGPDDPVFSRRYLDDLLARLPHADVHRYDGASHLVLEDRPEAVRLVWDWVGRLDALTTAPDAGTDPSATPGRSAVEPVPIRVDRTDPSRPAVVELGGGGRRIDAGALADQVDAVARGLAAAGVRPGQRVAVLVPPGIDLTTLVYAVWRLGAVVVVADAGLGLARLAGVLRGAAPDHVVAVPAGLALARVGRVPGRRLPFDAAGVADLVHRGAGTQLPAEDVVGPMADGAVLFTSGATGPPKGVVYTRRQLGAQVALLRDTFDLLPGERFVAAFAPFALYGPALGLTAAVPDMDPTAPDTLTAAALADTVAAVDATCFFASPAALRNVVATAAGLSDTQRAVLGSGRLRLVLSAGAPVPVDLLLQVKELLPGAATHTPYGMTEALPVATTDPTTEPAEGPGVCVGRPVPGVDVALAPLDAGGRPSSQGLTSRPGTLGEITVRGPHVKDRYDRLWGTQQASAQPVGWHRTGDVGELDQQGRLWVAGRLAHVISTTDGPVTPYAVERAVMTLPEVAQCAVVGVGPTGLQQVVAVVVPRDRAARLRLVLGSREVAALGPGPSALAPLSLADAVRAVSPVPVAAVLQRDWLPVDIRHAAKVDRLELAVWAAGLLHGRGAARDLRRSQGQGSAGRRRAPSRRAR